MTCPGAGFNHHSVALQLQLQSTCISLFYVILPPLPLLAQGHYQLHSNYAAKLSASDGQGRPGPCVATMESPTGTSASSRRFLLYLFISESDASSTRPPAGRGCRCPTTAPAPTSPPPPPAPTPARRGARWSVLVMATLTGGLLLVLLCMVCIGEESKKDMPKAFQRN